MKTVLSSIVTSSVLAAFAIAPPARRYTITDLGTLGGTYSYAYRINNAGVVAGGIATSTQIGVNQTASLWYGRHLIDLGTLDLKKCPTCNSAARDPNGVASRPWFLKPPRQIRMVWTFALSVLTVLGPSGPRLILKP